MEMRNSFEHFCNLCPLFLLVWIVVILISKPTPYSRHYLVYRKMNSFPSVTLTNLGSSKQIRNRTRGPIETSAIVLDPDPETFSRIRIRKNHSGSKQLRIRNEFEIKLLWETDKNWIIFQKMLYFKNMNSIFQKIPLKSIYISSYYAF